jgi:hypothetical protein
LKLTYISSERFMNEMINAVPYDRVIMSDAVSVVCLQTPDWALPRLHFRAAIGHPPPTLMVSAASEARYLPGVGAGQRVELRLLLAV